MKIITVERKVMDNYSITDGEYFIVRQLCTSNMLITAIKFIRWQYNLGLYEAKKIVEAIRDGVE